MSTPPLSTDELLLLTVLARYLAPCGREALVPFGRLMSESGLRFAGFSVALARLTGRGMTITTGEEGRSRFGLTAELGCLARSLIGSVSPERASA